MTVHDIAATNDAPVNSGRRTVRGHSKPTSPTAVTSLAVSRSRCRSGERPDRGDPVRRAGHDRGGHRRGRRDQRRAGQRQRLRHRGDHRHAERDQRHFRGGRGDLRSAADGIDALAITTNDLGNGGSGGAQQDVDAVVVTVINVNQDPPLRERARSRPRKTPPRQPRRSVPPIPTTTPWPMLKAAGSKRANGTVIFDQVAGTFTYTPDPDFHGARQLHHPQSTTATAGRPSGRFLSHGRRRSTTTPRPLPPGSATASEDGASAPISISAGDIDGDILELVQKWRGRGDQRHGRLRSESPAPSPIRPTPTSTARTASPS